MPSRELPRRNPPPPGFADAAGAVGLLARMIRHLTAAASPDGHGWAHPSLAYVKFAREQVERTLGAMVRYCPECGHVGPVREGARDCCPDGNNAVMVTPKVAAQARAGFLAGINPDHGDAKILRDHAAWCDSQAHNPAMGGKTPGELARIHGDIVEALSGHLDRMAACLKSAFGGGAFKDGGIVPGAKNPAPPLLPGERLIPAAMPNYPTHGEPGALEQGEPE